MIHILSLILIVLPRLIILLILKSLSWYAYANFYLIVFQTSNPSKSSPEVLPPASFSRVGNQSVTCIRPVLIVPGFLIRGLLTNPTPFIPPSHSDPFQPLRGQLLPPSCTCPPLSKIQLKY